MVTGSDSPVRAAWSMSTVPSLMEQSAGTAAPRDSATRSPGTRYLASTFFHTPSRFTCADGFREAFSSATASAALVAS
eukprot:scaffold2857_cov344-Pavlova_lutheri.AAC.10